MILINGKVFSVIKNSIKNYHYCFHIMIRQFLLNPQVPLFYLMYAKDKWQLSKDIPQARSILN